MLKTERRKFVRNVCCSFCIANAHTLITTKLLAANKLSIGNKNHIKELLSYEGKPILISLRPKQKFFFDLEISKEKFFDGITKTNLFFEMPPVSLRPHFLVDEDNLPLVVFKPKGLPMKDF